MEKPNKPRGYANGLVPGSQFYNPGDEYLAKPERKEALRTRTDDYKRNIGTIHAVNNGLGSQSQDESYDRIARNIGQLPGGSIGIDDYKYANLAKGGVIPGHDLTGRDDVPVNVTKGEAILPVKTVDAMGGPGAVKSLIKATNGKKPAVGLKNGGKYARGLIDDEKTRNLREFYAAQNKPVMQSVGEGIGEFAGATARGIGTAARNLEDTRKATLNIANNLPGAIAAPIANAAGSFGATVRTAYNKGGTGDQYVGNEYVGRPLLANPVTSAVAAPVVPPVNATPKPATKPTVTAPVNQAPRVASNGATRNKPAQPRTSPNKPRSIADITPESQVSPTVAPAQPPSGYATMDGRGYTAAANGQTITGDKAKTAFDSLGIGHGVPEGQTEVIKGLARFNADPRGALTAQVPEGTPKAMQQAMSLSGSGWNVPGKVTEQMLSGESGLTQESMRNKTAITTQGMGDATSRANNASSNATSRANNNVAHGADNTLKQIELGIAQGLASEDPAKQAAALKRRQRLNANKPAAEKYSPLMGKDEMGNPVYLGAFDTRTGNMKGASDQSATTPAGTTKTVNGQKVQWDGKGWKVVK